jgi:uncharacterized protein (TIGR03435 family)
MGIVQRTTAFKSAPEGCIMILRKTLAALLISASTLLAQSPTPSLRPKFDTFEVATIKPVDPGATAGRFIIMQGNNRFVEKSYTLKLLIAAAYDLNPRTISGGPSWIESDHYDIVAVTPGEIRPTHDEQMSMLRSLLTDRFKLTFHREPKTFSIYEIEMAKPGKPGPKLKETATPTDPPTVGPGVVYPQRIVLPAHNATIADLASLLQRAILDRPVVDKTGLTARYDFDLEWAPDETQFGGDVPTPSADTPASPLFTAIQEQLGLRLVATRGPVDALIIDTAERPSAN